jgi:hypothetical protein
MSVYLLLLELFFFFFTVYIVVRKEELSLIYLPVLFFSRNVFVPSTRAIFWYMILVGIMGYIIFKNRGFSKYNPYAIMLVIYFTALFYLSSDMTSTRTGYIQCAVLFLSLPLIQNIYKKYDRASIENEIYKVSVIILLIFLSNVILSSLTGYTGARDRTMYGLTGILYGNLRVADLNILPFALFFVLYRLSARYSTTDLIISVITFSSLVLSMRRSIMVAATAASGIFLLMLLLQRNKSNAIVTTYALAVVVIIAIMSTDVLDIFKDRYEHRRLDEREFVNVEESRFIEYELIYYDMFIDNAYSPWFGFELLNSPGNYGNGIFGDRSLHSDLPVIIHSSGIIGLMLYLLMIFRAYAVSFKFSKNSNDRLVLLFCFVALIIFSLTGRFTHADYMIMMFLFVLLPVSSEEGMYSAYYGEKLNTYG